MKTGLFTDPHYCPADLRCKTRRPRLSLGKIKTAYSAFTEKAVELVICLGDLTDGCDAKAEAVGCVSEIADVVSGSGIPFLFVPGNHDCYDLDRSELADLLPSPQAPFCAKVGDITFIGLDANYRSDGRRFDVAGVEWTDSNLPSDQLDFLSGSLAGADGRCVILIHEDLDPNIREDHRVNNADAIRDIIERSGKVELVIEGHYHKGADNTVNGIRYLTLPAVCEGESNPFLIVDL